jgi:hypothetical protein
VIKGVSLFFVVLCTNSREGANSFLLLMKSTHTNSVKPKRKEKRKPPGTSDPLTREHSKRHGKAVKSGIKKAKEFKHAVLRAASRARGKSKAQVAAELLVGSVPRTAATVCVPSPEDTDGRRSPSLDWRAPQN